METSQTSVRATSSSGGLQNLMREHPLFSFFFLTYAFSWLLSIPYVLSQWNLLSGDYSIAFIVKSFGPFLAAYIMVRVTAGPVGLLHFKKSIRQVRAGWQWYLFILIVMPAPAVLGILLQPGALDSFQGFSVRFLITCLVSFVLVFLGGGPLGEEPGWRGFALPRMQPLYGPLRGSLLLGVLWTFWHLPDFLTSQQGGGPGTGLTPFLVNLPIFLLFVASLAIIFTWLFNHTQGSIFIAIFAHACINLPQVVFVPLFPNMDFTKLDTAALIGYGTLALLIVILTRGQLGYRAGSEQPLTSTQIEAQPIR